MIVGFAALAFWHPKVVAWPMAVFAVWIGLSFLAEAFGLLKKRGRLP
jgi:hypothetical protein